MKTEYKLPGNRVFTIHHDENAESPRDMGDYLGTMVCHHRRYSLGDPRKHNYGIGDFDSAAELKAAIMRDHKPLAILPLYLLDHSGLSMSTKPFSCPWDSGLVGFIFVQKKDKLNLWGNRRLTKKRAEQILQHEVEEYNQYLQGECYGYRLEKIETCNLGHEHRTEEESCWGFIGSDHEKSGILDNLDKEDREAVLTAMGKRVAA